ncbi:non-structural maintenance of chromosomes element 1 homolog [Anopheles ziemanni]|uniref:non-structural maintenance of chromosomes element 1 homolog n=1 Tax=Anopheles coustani TaxID=139045 RepID=UPI0026596226|nr:non-structural maintenance of chromosomes element 1 homolog [Anopheles coustani]XP_058168135.1 non-structural maintenance of chromosomes element 1 homolog [Anopheles ziemanni]
MTYSNVHRAFLQACSNHGTLSSQQAYEILIGIYARYGETETVPKEDVVAEVVSEINSRIYPYDQKIAYMHYDPTDTDFYVFVSLMESPIDLQQNNYTVSELHYFRALLRELTLSEDHQLPSIACLNLTNESASEGNKALSKPRAEQLLSEWEGLGYFLVLQDKCYFGPKAIVEFDKYLNTNYADVITRCCLCNVTIFYGIRCASCPQILHKDCLKKYLRRLTNCPSCKKLWSVPV